MANLDHLAKLEEGVEAWNRWRKENRGIEIDLIDAELRHDVSMRRDLSGYDLSGANLIRAKLTNVSLARANLNLAKMNEINLDRVDLRRADLSEASVVSATLVRTDLRGANLHLTNLSDAYLRNAKFEGADLTEAYVSDADLAGANLTGANLKMAELSDADLRGAKLTDANMSQAILVRADLSEASLSQVNLSDAVMSHCNLTRAYLGNANLKDADLRSANMRGANLTGANLDKLDLRSANLQFAILENCSADAIRLWETQRAGWTLKGIGCERAYWDKDAEQLTSYTPGEFERLYSDFTTIEFFYQGGVSTFELSTLPAMLRHLAALHEGVNIRLKSIEETGGGAKISISLGDTDAETTEKIKADAMRVFQSQLALRDDQITRLRIEKEYAEAFSDKLIQRMLTATAPSNIFNAPVYNAAFASGSSSIAADQSIAQTVHDNAALLSLLETMLNRLADLGLSSSAADRFKDQVNTVATELNKKEPDKSVLAKSLGFVRELAKEGLKKAAGTLGEHAVSADWHGWFTQLQELSHHLHL